MGANLRIGATVDVAELKAGMQQTVDEVKTAAQKIPIAFEEARGRTKAALNGISEDTKQAAQVVSIESAKVAQATKQFAQAQAELRNATVVAKDAKLDDAETTNLLAAAQQKAAAAAKNLAEAKADEARAVAAAAEEEELSQNVVIRAFQRAAAAVTEASAEIKEQLISTAEVGGLEAEGITAGFAGFSKLLGAGIAVGFAANYIDGLAKMNVELDHLSVQSGLAVPLLAGLQQIVREMGGEWDPIATGLIKMNQALASSKEPSKELKDALHGIGLSAEELQGLRPEEQLQKLSTAFAETANSGNRAAAARAVFGRGGAALVPVLVEEGKNLTSNAEATGKLTGVTEESAEAARRWTQDTARLSAQFRSVMIPVMEHAEDVIRGIAATFEAASAVILTVFEAIGTAVTAALFPLGKLGQMLFDLTTGQYAKLISDAKAAPAQFASVWKAGFDDIKGYWAEVKRTLTESTPVPKLEQEFEPGEGPAPSAKKKGVDKAFENDERELAGIRLQAAKNGYVLGVQGEIEFWNKRLAAAKQGSEEYQRIVEKLASLEEERIKQGSKPQKFAEVKESTISTSTLDSIISEMTAEVKEQQKQQLDAQREAIDEQIRDAAEGYRVAEEYANEQVRMGLMTTQERIAYLRQAAAEELRIEQALIQGKEIIDNGDLAKQQQDANRSVQITRQADRQIAQLMRESAQDTQRVWRQAWDNATASFNNAVAHWVVSGKGFAQSMAQIMGGITENFVRNVLKMSEQFLIGLALQKAGQKSQIFADAKTAAANTYAAVSAIPVVGPFLAPPAAAAAFAGVLAFDSFAEGGVVRGGNGMAVPVLAHAGERVLTPSQTQNFETLVSNRSSSSSHSSRTSIDLDQHFYGSKATPREAARGINDAIRRGRVGYA
ncbi:MAG: hypothetical protein JST28_09085 [Acidobacteria bacterium]|nr:hypothetical protein [Acidobacteriota bacterium]